MNIAIKQVKTPVKNSPVSYTEVLQDLSVFLGGAIYHVWTLDSATDYSARKKKLKQAEENLNRADALADVEFVSVDKQWYNRFQKHIEWCAANSLERSAIYFAYLRDAIWNRSAEDFNEAYRQLGLLKGQN